MLDELFHDDCAGNTIIIMASRTRADRQPARGHSSTSPTSTATRMIRPMFRTLRTIARIASIASIAGFGHAPPDWPRFHDTAHRGCSLTHALHPAHCTPAPHTRHTATRHPERKPPAASHTDRTRSRLSALHAAPPRIVRHCLQRDTCSHFAHSPLARATLHSGVASLRVARWPPLLLPFRPLLMSLRLTPRPFR